MLALLAAQPTASSKAATATPSSPAVAELGRGFAAYRAGDYHGAVPILRAAATKDLRGKDWALFVLAESEFYDGNYRGARDNFEKLARGHGRPAQMAPFRIADCLWMEGDHAKAATSYARLAKTATARTGDVALARFRVAEQSGRARQGSGAASSSPSRAISRRTRCPTRRCAGSARPRPRPVDDATAPPTPQTTPPTAPPAADLAPADRLKRAESLSKDRHWDEALAELARLPADAGARSRRRARLPDRHDEVPHAPRLPDGGRAAAGRVDHLSGDKAASAQFHGARALSRVDRDDEAIAGYRKVITQFPHSRFAPEAQYLSGWLEYNRGRFRESIPAFEATLKNFGGSAFADDAAWSLAFAHFLLGDTAEAAAGFDRYGRLPPTGHRVRRDCRAREVLARARARRRPDSRRRPRRCTGISRGAVFVLRAAGAGAPQASRPPGGRSRCPARRSTSRAPSKPLREPSIARATELIEAGLNVEAGEELEQNEKEILKHLGGDKALPWLIDLYKRAGNYHRVYRLGESRGRRRWAPIRCATRARARCGRRRIRAPTSRWSTSTAPPPTTRSSFSTRSCARNPGSTRTTSRTRTRAASCR